MTPSLSEPFCFPESLETPYSVITNGSVIHPLSLNYRSQFFWLHFVKAYGSICKPYNSTPQFTSGIYYNGLGSISSLTLASLSRKIGGGQKSNEIWQLHCPPSVPSNLSRVFFPHLYSSPTISLHSVSHFFHTLCVHVCFPLLLIYFFMAFAVLPQTTPNLP